MIAFATLTSKRGKDYSQKHIERSVPFILGFCEVGSEPVKTAKTWRYLHGRPILFLVTSGILCSLLSLLHPAFLAGWLAFVLVVLPFRIIAMWRERSDFQKHFDRVFASCHACVLATVLFEHTAI